MKKIFVIDNYDSFTYNLVHYLEDLGCIVTVKRNDKFELKELNDNIQAAAVSQEDFENDRVLRSELVWFCAGYGWRL